MTWRIAKWFALCDYYELPPDGRLTKGHTLTCGRTCSQGVHDLQMGTAGVYGLQAGLPIRGSRPADVFDPKDIREGLFTVGFE